MATVKTCFKCGIDKPRTEFYGHPAMADGLLGKCKVCTRTDARNTRAAKPEYYRAYDNKRSELPHRKELAERSFKRAENNHPERKKACSILYSALKSGRVKRHPCWVCGEIAEAHHPAYDQPLDVVWLCRSHHMQAHGLLRRIDDIGTNQ